MSYEIVNLEQKAVVGIKIRTSNSSPSVQQEINGVWQQLCTQGMSKFISNRIDSKYIGLYTNFENGVNGKYDFLAGCEVSGTENLPDGLEIKVIPAGKYAKFAVRGNTEAVNACWSEIRQTKLDQKFDCDFEEYVEARDLEHMEVYIYISLNS